MERIFGAGEKRKEISLSGENKMEVIIFLLEILISCECLSILRRESITFSISDGKSVSMATTPYLITKWTSFATYHFPVKESYRTNETVENSGARFEGEVGAGKKNISARPLPPRGRCAGEWNNNRKVPETKRRGLRSPWLDSGSWLTETGRIQISSGKDVIARKYQMLDLPWRVAAWEARDRN